MDISIFTAAMRQEFLRSMQAVAEPAPFESFTTVIPSTARIENYAWMTPAPGISRYMGHRRKAQIDEIRYSVENLEYDGTLTVPTRDIEDDIVGGYKLRMKDLTQKAQAPFRSRLLMQTLAKGTTLKGFDETSFFATAHNLGEYNAAPTGFGGGGNSLTYTASAMDGGTYRFVYLIHTGMLKPLVYQDRKPPRFNTDAGTKQSLMSKEANYWIDLEAAAAFGYWWDAVLCTITNKPTIEELRIIIDGVRQAFRGFRLPRALPTDPVERVHEQTEWTQKNCTVVTDSKLEQLFRHLANEERIGVEVGGVTGFTNNIYAKTFNVVMTGYLDV